MMTETRVTKEQRYDGINAFSIYTIVCEPNNKSLLHAL